MYGVQYRLVFVGLFGKFPIPTLIIVDWHIRQACSQGGYPDGLFGHRLESGELGGSPHLRAGTRAPHSSTTTLEANNGLGSNGILLLIALYA